MPPSPRMSSLPLTLVGVLLLAACQDADSPEPTPASAAPSTEVLAGETLLERFPEEVGPYPLGASSTDLDGALGFQVSRATARYTMDVDQPGPAVSIDVLDLGTAEMVQNMGFGWGTEADTTGVENFDGHPAQIEASERTRSTKIRALVGERFLVEVTGEGVAREHVEEATRALDLDGLAAIATR